MLKAEHLRLIAFPFPAYLFFYTTFYHNYLELPSPCLPTITWFHKNTKRRTHEAPPWLFNHFSIALVNAIDKTRLPLQASRPQVMNDLTPSLHLLLTSSFFLLFNNYEESPSHPIQRRRNKNLDIQKNVGVRKLASPVYNTRGTRKPNGPLTPLLMALPQPPPKTDVMETYRVLQTTIVIMAMAGNFLSVIDPVVVAMIRFPLHLISLTPRPFI